MKQYKGLVLVALATVVCGACEDMDQEAQLAEMPFEVVEAGCAEPASVLVRFTPLMEREAWVVETYSEDEVVSDLLLRTPDAEVDEAQQTNGAVVVTLDEAALDVLKCDSRVRGVIQRRDSNPEIVIESDAVFAECRPHREAVDGVISEGGLSLQVLEDRVVLSHSDFKWWSLGSDLRAKVTSQHGRRISIDYCTDHGNDFGAFEIVSPCGFQRLVEKDSAPSEEVCLYDVSLDITQIPAGTWMLTLGGQVVEFEIPEGSPLVP